MNITKLAEGEPPGYTLYAVVSAKQKCEIRDHIDSLNKRDKNQVMERLKRLSKYGDPQNRQQFEKMENSKEIYEIKTTNVRIFSFKSHPETGPYGTREPLLENSMILLFAKKKNEIVHKKKLRREIKRAEELRDDFFSGCPKIISV